MELLVGLVFGLFIALICWIKRQQSYWQRRGIPHNKPTLFASITSRHISYVFRETYNQFKGSGPFAGLYFLVLKSTLVLDIELVKNILIKDFSNFQDRGLYHNARDDPLSANIFFVEGEHWKRLRSKLTPTFTTGKMKNMFPMVLHVGQQLADVLRTQLEGAPQGKVLEVTDLMSRFTADTIGLCAFGLECNSLHNEVAEFVDISKRFFVAKRRHNKLVEGLIFSFPNIARKLGMRIVQQEVHDFYMQLVQKTVAYRRGSKVRRNDFMDLLMDMMEREGADGKKVDGLTMEEIAAQAFIIFGAGFETSSTTMGFVLYELARHPQVQEKLRQEIADTLANNDEQLSYEILKLPYLEYVIDETLRMHPIVPNLMRIARESYNTGNPKYYIEKGTLVIIPSIAIHYDPEFYPEPLLFKPERFEPEVAQKRPACSWLPFGEGPRNCVGLRFGRMQTSVGLIQLMRNFRFSVDEETEIPYKLPTNAFVITPENGIKLRVEVL